MLNAPVLHQPSIRHGFLTREGGVSRGVYAGLNCGPGSDDDPVAIGENRRRALAQLGVAGAELVTAHQSHSADVAVISALAPTTPPRADALVSATAGVALGILTADCVPVLLADPEARVIGALHAGWKGAVAGIVANTVAAMIGLGARGGALRAAIGPCIRQEAYEVGADLRDTVLAAGAGDAVFFACGRRPQHWQFDLPGYVAARLAAAGVNTVADVGGDTYGDEQRFYSYRRATHRGETGYGRQMALIALFSGREDTVGKT